MKRRVYEFKLTTTAAGRTLEEAADFAYSRLHDDLEYVLKNAEECSRIILEADDFDRVYRFVSSMYKIEGMTYEKLKPLLDSFIAVNNIKITPEDLEEVYTWCERLMDFEDEDDEAPMPGVIETPELLQKMEDFNCWLAEEGSPLSLDVHVPETHDQELDHPVFIVMLEVGNPDIRMVPLTSEKAILEIEPRFFTWLVERFGVMEVINYPDHKTTFKLA